MSDPEFGFTDQLIVTDVVLRRRRQTAAGHMTVKKMRGVLGGREYEVFVRRKLNKHRHFTAGGATSRLKEEDVIGQAVSQGDATEKLAHQVAAQVTAADRRFEEASGDADEEEKDEAHESSKGHVSEPAVECVTSPEFTSPQTTFDMEHKDDWEPRVRPLTRQTQISRPQKQREKNEAQRRRPAVQTDMYHSRPSACVSVETVHTQSVGPTNNSCVHLFPGETGCSLNSVM
ncbi:hypothetical protein JOB18_010420 [Solea senegalensis]|uniref:Uncharacterized protein n=1 Tax=Solea senegalensis TaxID=28829 RepID=A0AAV6Q8S5_SOLSE|nr:hypothetical protein JOB18_010420 [Solea senegalensis]